MARIVEHLVEADVVRLTIYGRPATKKNSMKIIPHPRQPGRQLVVQGDTWAKYEREALRQIRMLGGGRIVRGKVHMQVRYWMPNRRGWPDLFGLLQGTADILQGARVIENDKLIVSTDGSEIAGIDKENPRAEIVVTARREHDKW